MITLQESLSQLSEKLSGWLEQIILMLPNFVLAIVVMLVFGLAGKLLKRVVGKILEKFSDNLAVNRLISQIANIGIILVGLFIALGIIQLKETVVTLLTGLGIAGLALGFAFQDIAANFMSGILIAIRKPFKIGDLVESHGFLGTIEQMTMRTTVIRNFQGQLIVLPNKDIFQGPLTNYSTGERRIDLEVGVSYGDDLDKVEKVAVDAIKQVEYADLDRPVDLYYTSFGDSSINFVVRFWMDFEKQANFLAARSDAIKQIKSAFDSEDISIPFPIRTLDFGIKGGVSMKEMMPVSRTKEKHVYMEPSPSSN